MRKLFTRLLALLVLGYLGLCGFIYAQQRTLMYFPDATRVEAAQTNFEFRSGNARLRGWVLNPGRDRAILYFGGNAERVELNRDAFTRWFPNATIYLIPYRGYGPNDGSPDEATLFADALALYDTVRKRQPEASIAVIGRSLGTGVASYLASQRRIGKLALLTPFDSMAKVAQAHYPWLPVRWMIQDRYESARYLRDFKGQVLIVRAGKDEVIPADNTYALAMGLTTRPQLVVLPDAWHNSILRSPLLDEALTGFLR